MERWTVLKSLRRHRDGAPGGPFCGGVAASHPVGAAGWEMGGTERFVTAG